MQLRLADAESTESLGRLLAITRPSQAVVHLQGDLGAGKSTLARALLRELGVKGAIRSPTYTLVERYPVPGGEAWHLDLYRIGDTGELDFLGLTMQAPPCGWSNGRKKWAKPCRRLISACNLPTTGRAGRCSCRLDRLQENNGWRLWPFPRGCAHYLFNLYRKWRQVADY